MSLSRFNQAFAIGLTLLATPLLCLPAAITANGTDEFGTGANPGTLPSGGSVNSSCNFFYTFGDGDNYYVTTTYSAADSPLNMSFTVNALYLGQTGNPTALSAAADSLNVDFWQNFDYTASATASGNSNATLVETGNAAGSYAEAQLFFDGQGIGLMGPFFGPGSETATAGPTSITGLGNPVSGDFRYTLYFAAGTSPIPEPATARFLLLAFLVFSVPAFWRYHRKARN